MNGTHPNGNITYNAAAEIKKGQPVKFAGSTTTTGMPTVTPCAAATDAAIGVALEPANAGGNVPVAILGNYTGTVDVLAGGAVSRGAIELDSSKVTDGTMKVRTLTLQGEDGGTQTVQYLATSDAVISPGERNAGGDEGEDEEEEEEPVTGYCNDISGDGGEAGGPDIATGEEHGPNAISEDPDRGNDISNDPCKRGAE